MNKCFERSGSIPVLALPFLVGIVLSGFFIVNWGRLHYALQKAQSLADESLQSSLRLRVEGLGKVAKRWEEFGALFSRGDLTGGTLSRGDFNAVEESSKKLKRAIPGYGGRTKAAIKVVAEANGARRDQIIFSDDHDFTLGIIAESLPVRFEEGGTGTVNAGWYKRNWALDKKQGTFTKTTRCEAEVFVPVLFDFGLGPGEGWHANSTSEGRMEWDVDQKIPLVQLIGNGGFPRAWDEAVSNFKINPHRFPLFEARLLNEE